MQQNNQISPHFPNQLKMAGVGEAPMAEAKKAVICGRTVERGGGGKLRRGRKPPATPYDRPPSGSWISRIVDPAKRLFSGLPSLFSHSLPFIQVDDEVHEEVEQEAGDVEENCSEHFVAPKSAEGVGPSKVKEKSKVDISGEDGLDKREGCSDGGAPDIEQLINGKTFSREEIDRLMKILHSRVVDVERDIKTPYMTGQDDVERAETSNQRQKTSVHEEEELDGFQLATSATLCRPTMQDKVGASPVDIAKAYMGSRTSEVGFPSASLVWKTEKLGFTSESSSNPVAPSPLRKAPICWPGAFTQNQRDYSTPLSQNNRSSLHSFPRTPYSRTIYSKSKSKLTPLLGDNERFPSISPAPFQPTATTVYGKVQSISNVAEGSYGTGGPIRRTRNKFTSATPARESTLCSTARRSPLARESNVDFMPKKTFELDSSSHSNIESVNSKAESPKAGVRSVHPHSNRLARKILEQLDRPITLKEQSKELKLAVSGKDSSTAALLTPIQNISSSDKVGVGVGKSNDVDGVKLAVQVNGESNVLPLERNKTLTGSGKDVDSTISLETNGPLPNIGRLDSQRSPEQGINDNLPNTSLLFGDSNKAKAAITNNAARSELQNSQRKPMLPSIAITSEKSGINTSFPSITSPGFTFPVTTSSTTFTELSTPSIMPSFSTSPPQQPKVSGNLPTFTPGKKITIASPVVADSSKTTVFNSTDALAPKFKLGSEKHRLSFAVAGDDTAAPNDAAIPKFKFGSGKSRLNFGSIGSDAVCY